jgi:catechol 2,3-dioxygenase-like lactoylglutathione lyase family enzyme
VARFASGAPAAVVSFFGKGRALVLGSFVSAGYVSQPAEATRRFYEGLLGWAGVERPVEASGDPVEVRILASGEARLVFVFNHAGAPATATLRVHLPLAGRAVHDLASGEAVSVAPSSDGFEWRAALPPREVRVLVVEASGQRSPL